MARYQELALTFAFGFFLTLGVLTLSNRFAQTPRTFEVAAVLAFVGGGCAVVARVQRR